MAGTFNSPRQEISRKRLTVPRGFRNLLEGLTTEILRSNPSDIYTFAADYFKSRLQERQERGYDDCLLGSQIDGYYRYEPLRDSREELDAAATKIQSTFRGHKARRETSRQKTKEPRCFDHAYTFPSQHSDGFGEKGHAAAVRIQAGYRGYSTRKELKAQNEAAIAIQAGYRGYTVRKGFKQKFPHRPYLQRIEEENSAKIDQPQADQVSTERLDEEAAAIKIQSVFRGHQIREAVKNEREADNDCIGGNELQRNEAATKIQANYRGYYDRKQLENKYEAATKIQASYRGYSVRKLRHTRSDAAVKIQSHYRGYKTRQQLRTRHSTKSLLKVTTGEEFALHRDSRTSFSLPVGLKFEGPLDEDSDAEIEKMVNDLQAKQELKAIEEAPDTETSKAEGS